MQHAFRDKVIAGGWKRLRQLIRRLSHLGYGIARKFADGQLNLAASSLAYTTLLALVPLLAVSFSVLKAFGVHNALQPLLLEFVGPLGAQGKEVVNRILSFVDNLQVGVLGSLGIALLFYTVISLISQIERVFNTMWRVTAARSLGRSFSDYLSVTLIGPVLMFAALGLASAAMDSIIMRQLLDLEPLGSLFLSINRVIPYGLTAGAFAFLYGFIPNTYVRPSAALAGGLFAGVLWFASGKLFTSFVVSSSNYSAVYSSFAGAVLFIIWLYTGWLILLVGGQVAVYWQHPRWLDYHRFPDIYNHRREALALELMTLIGVAHHTPRPPPTLASLQSRYHGADYAAVASLLQAFELHQLITANSDQPPAYLPARATETISLHEVLQTVCQPESAVNLASVAEIMRHIDVAIAQTLANRTVKDLALAEINSTLL